ncbi:phosphoserine phosphatase SerB [Sphingomonas baiyangensis]|uniref:Phosphoserine phosphatase n=1 Tax=Sphingomonas baiyangensis TaxID=2572576 RepID=A0A4U1L035_9SPHN|nr:phosphoserine phosphatase SerB [Sphingomonas baiyangensis]TKD50071.1 phosphoserine phosphatase SerB [Sphingomonas baiyangensis]
MFITTLIASDRLDAADLARARTLLNEAGCAPEAPAWIDEGQAADIAFLHDATAARTAIEDAFAGIDIVVQPAAHRRKRLLIADMDSTMIAQECIDELADYAGLKPQIAAVTEAAMRGELDFAAALDARVALLAGLGEDAIERCLAERVTLTPGARTLVQTMRAHGAMTILVSGGFTRFADAVGKAIGFDRVIANRLLIEGGALTGAVAKPIVDSATKEATLRAACAERDLTLDQAMAVGDGANDLPMLRAAGLGIAYRAKPVVAAEADARIEQGDLTALLYAQGIPRSEWVTS